MRSMSRSPACQGWFATLHVSAPPPPCVASSIDRERVVVPLTSMRSVVWSARDAEGFSLHRDGAGLPFQARDRRARAAHREGSRLQHAVGHGVEERLVHRALERRHGQVVVRQVPLDLRKLVAGRSPGPQDVVVAPVVAGGQRPGCHDPSSELEYLDWLSTHVQKCAVVVTMSVALNATRSVSGPPNQCLPRLPGGSPNPARSW